MDGAVVPLAVACGEEGDCPALDCGDSGCQMALLSCPEDRRCPVPAGESTPARLPRAMCSGSASCVDARFVGAGWYLAEGCAVLW